MSRENKVGNTLANASEKTTQISNLVSTKRQYIFKQIINGILLFVILFVFGCFDFAHLKFHYEYLIDANYWVNVTTKGIADICAYNVGINVVIDDVIKRNIVLQELSKLYEKLNNCKQMDFEDFIVEYNKECKIVAYKHEINHKIYKLNKHSKRSDKLLYYKEPNNTTNKYCIHRRELEHLKTDEYILANIDSIDVRYRDIDASVFDLEINGAQKIVTNTVTGSLKKGRIVASATTILGVVGISMFFNSFSLEPNKEEFVDGVAAAVNYVMRTFIDIGIVAWQFLRGILTTHSIVSKQITIPLEERVRILKLYYAWRQQKSLSVPKCYVKCLEEKEEKEEEKPTEVKEEVKEIEMTEEEYKRLLANDTEKERNN